MLADSGAKVQTCFYLRDLVTCTGDGKIRSVSGRLGMSMRGYFFQGGASQPGEQPSELPVGGTVIIT